jgi:glycosyltransferase involved in cell wall biosynthesis
VSPPRVYQREEDTWLLYHGSLGPALLPRSVLEALAGLPASIKLRVIGYETIGTRGYAGELCKLAVALGMSERFEFLGALPRFQLAHWRRRSHIGIALIAGRAENRNLATLAGASNKAFDYLADGLPVLVSDRPDWRAMYVEPGYGVACVAEDSGSIAKALKWFLAHPQETREMGERGRQRIAADWNYERQFAPVKKLLIDDRETAIGAAYRHHANLG